MILISAGHNPTAQGACFGGFCEHKEAMRWALEIVGIIGSGSRLVPTGSLTSKVDFINAHNPKVAVEIHFNSAKDNSGNHVGHGSETLYMPGSVKGKSAAMHVHAAYAPLFLPDRGVKEGWYQMNPAKGPDYFLKATSCPAMILEPDFIHRQKIIQDNRGAACKLIADALMELA